MSKAQFYHAGCPVCVAAEQTLPSAIDPRKYEIEVIHLGQDRARIADAEQAGVQSVPALVIDDTVLHINFGASLETVKAGV